MEPLISVLWLGCLSCSSSTLQPIATTIELWPQQPKSLPSICSMALGVWLTLLFFYQWHSSKSSLPQNTANRQQAVEERNNTQTNSVCARRFSIGVIGDGGHIDRLSNKVSTENKLSQFYIGSEKVLVTVRKLLLDLKTFWNPVFCESRHPSEQLSTFWAIIYWEWIDRAVENI